MSSTNPTAEVTATVVSTTSPKPPPLPKKILLLADAADNWYTPIMNPGETVEQASDRYVRNRRCVSLIISLATPEPVKVPGEKEIRAIFENETRGELTEWHVWAATVGFRAGVKAAGGTIHE